MAEFGEMPQRTPAFASFFSRYARRRLEKSFHAVRVTKDSYPTRSLPKDRSVVAFANHPAWWDPLVALAISEEFFPKRIPFAPIEAKMLEKYGIFKHLGFFGVDRESPVRGARQFLRQAKTILSEPSSLLWVTPQGEFADVRERPLRLESGLTHLAKRHQESFFLPFTVEYVFWWESKAEVLLHMGPPVNLEASRSVKELQEILTSSLEQAADDLAEKAMLRNENDFKILLQGSFGASFFYDAWRKLKGRVTGKEASNRHHA